jgi:ABC-type multidrug transport system fused ATPase/permease subunit
LIDGVEISHIPKEELRKRVTVVPQEPVLFTGTLRFNLDPLNNHRDHELIRLLKRANLTRVLQQDSKGLY